MKSLRIVVPAFLVLLLAACSVPIGEQKVDLGLGLESQRIVMKRPPINLGLSPSQMADFIGSIEVQAKKVDSRLTFSSVELLVELFQEVRVTPADALDGVDTVRLEGFTVSFQLSDGGAFVEVGSLDVPVVVNLNLVEGTGNWELDAGDEWYKLVFLNTAMNQINDIITGPETEQFTFRAEMEFRADLPEGIELEFRLQDGEATVRGRAKVI